MKLMCWKGEVMVAGINARFRRLLDAKAYSPARPLVREGEKGPPLVEVVYSSHVKPEPFLPGCGMEVPDRVESWMEDMPREIM